MAPTDDADVMKKLTAEQKRSLTQFMDAFSMSKDRENEAFYMLSQHNWDVNAASNEFAECARATFFGHHLPVLSVVMTRSPARAPAAQFQTVEKKKEKKKKAR